jgi:hypothetical protein
MPQNLSLYAANRTEFKNRYTALRTYAVGS